MSPTDSDCNKSKIHGDICSKNHCNIIDGVSVQELLSDNSRRHIDNSDIGRGGDEVIWIEKMPSTDPDRVKCKSHGNNCNSNRDGDRVSVEERGSDNLKSLE